MSTRHYLWEDLRSASRLSPVFRANLLQSQGLGLLFESGLDDFANHNAVIAVLMETDHLALHPRRRITDDRTPGVRASLIGKAAHLPTFRLNVLEEGERLPLLSGTEETQGEDFAVLDHGVGASIALDADHYLRWLEGTLRCPVDRSQGHFVTLLGTKHLETIGNHQQCGLFRL